MRDKNGTKSIITMAILAIACIAVLVGMIFIVVKHPSPKKTEVIKTSQNNDKEQGDAEASTAPSTVSIDSFTVSAEEKNSNDTTKANKYANVTTGDYVISDSNVALLTEEDVQGLTKEQLHIARNEIFARHGWIFKDKDLKAYFESKAWYKGEYSEEDFPSDALSDTETKNAELLKKCEESAK